MKAATELNTFNALTVHACLNFSSVDKERNPNNFRFCKYIEKNKVAVITEVWNCQVN